MVCTRVDYIYKYVQHVARILHLLTCFFCFIQRGEDVSDFQSPPHYVLMADCIYYEQVTHKRFLLFPSKLDPWVLIILSPWGTKLHLSWLLTLVSSHTVYCSTSGELVAALWTRHLHYLLLRAAHRGGQPQSGKAVFWGESQTVSSIG